MQGHSIKEVKDEELLTPITKETVFNYTQVVHGTYRNVLEPIMKTGLCRMARNSIHLAIGLPGEKGVISGMRSSCEIVIEIDIVKAVFAGVPFFVSKNNVVLTPGIGEQGYLPPEFFRCVFDFKTKEIIYEAPLKWLMVHDLECNCSN